MQIASLFTLLPLLAAVASATGNTNNNNYDNSVDDSSYDNSPAPQQEYGYGEQSAYQQDNDEGDYHDEPEQEDSEKQYGEDADERDYDKATDARVDDARYAPVSPTQTVVIVVAKSHHQTTTTSTTNNNFITSGPSSGARYQQQQGVDAQQQYRQQQGNGPQVQYTTPAGRPLTPATASFMFPINRTIAIRSNTKENKRRHMRKNELYPSHTKCLTVRRRGLRKRFKAVLEHCNDEQRFWLRSPMSFHFEDAGDDTVVMTWMDPKGLKRCAHHDVTGTRFYPCNGKKKPTRYDVLPTKYDGKFKIKQHSRNRCMDFDHSNLWMNRCRHFRDQALDVITIANDAY